ncbi:hypothetical protein BJY52DRAFT_1417591 [Lactarius psammicola]|nr:hypothetical protein BJY52DRAFT_1417591 [Lactarius psammicola]
MWGVCMTQLDINTPADAEKLHELVGGAEVFKFLQSYRLSSLAGRKFNPEECSAICPGILGGFNMQEHEVYAEYVHAIRGEEEATALPM